MNKPDPTRRTLLKYLGGTTTLALWPVPLLLGGCGQNTAADSTVVDPGTEKGPFDVEFTLRARPDVVPILPGAPSEVWRYSAELIKGPEDTLAQPDGSYVGPLIRLRRGQRVRVHIENGLPEDTTIHWHGLHVPPAVDGQPRFPVKPGTTKTIEYTVDDRAGLYWYHPHPHDKRGGRVGFQSCAGLAGPLIIEDDQHRKPDLPEGAQEILLTLQDRNFAGENELTYLSGGMGAMMSRMQGFKGDHLLVNGKPASNRDIIGQAYRLRILNGSNSRIYKLAWSDGRPVTVIGTGGGLLSRAEHHSFVTLAPAQRIDLWVSFAADVPGTSIQLVSKPHESGSMMGDHGMRRKIDSGLADNHAAIVTLTVTRRATTAVQTLPDLLSDDITSGFATTSPRAVRQFILGMKMMQGFTINGRQFEGTSVADDEVVTLGDTEIWEFFNDTMMPHPMHVHGLQFRVVAREAGGGRAGAELGPGIIDSGLHDTVLVLPGERVRIALTFKDFSGLYLYHCHNMEHEDNGMMRYYQVRE